MHRFDLIPFKNRNTFRNYSFQSLPMKLSTEKSIFGWSFLMARRWGVCFSIPHACYTFMKHLFSKSTELAFKGLPLSAGKYQALINGCWYLSHIIFWKLCYWLSDISNQRTKPPLFFSLHLHVLSREQVLKLSSWFDFQGFRSFSLFKFCLFLTSDSFHLH